MVHWHVRPVLELLPDGHGRRHGDGDGPHDGHEGEHGADADGAAVRVHDQLTAVERDGRDGEGRHEDGDALQHGRHRARQRVLAELKKRIQKLLLQRNFSYSDSGYSDNRLQ